MRAPTGLALQQLHDAPAYGWHGGCSTGVGAGFLRPQQEKQERAPGHFIGAPKFHRHRVFNIVILVQIVRAFRQVTHSGVYDAERIDDYLNQRGFLARIFRSLFKTVDASWKMYPVGFLFGLGFDTATEIGLFVLAGTVGSLHLPLSAAFLLPLLFTAGMCLADTTDGVMMLGAYGWAFVKPIRKLFYNMSITLISVLVALVIGTIEVLSIIGGQFNLEGPVWDFVGAVGDNSGYVGAGIIAIFILSWLLSTLIYRINRYDEIEVTQPAAPAAPAAPPAPTT
jgi:high-affinity nickel-transport protein